MMTSLNPEPPPLAHQLSTPVPYMTAASRDHVGDDSSGRRRYLTLLFSDLSGSTQLAETMDPEHYAELLGAFRERCHEIIPRYQGRIASIQGDGVLAIFGYPKAEEDDARRATEAALELHVAVSRIAVSGLALSTAPLALHSGIHGGLVYLAVGDAEQGRFAVGGDVSNTVARLSGLAQRGEIYVSEETLGPDAHFFATSERRLVNLKGRDMPVPVYRIFGRASVQSRFQARSMRGLTPFVGRDAELRALRDQIRKVSAGSPECVIVAGGPGLGKTRLIEEVVQDAMATQFAVLRGYCEGPLGAEPLQPFLQMLRTVCRLEPGMNATEATAAAERALAALPEIGDAARAALMQAIWLGPPGSGPRQPATSETIAALCSLFEALAANRPLLLVVDDLQWADDASQQVLDAIRNLRRPVFALLGSRSGSEAIAGPSIPTIELTPLELQEAGRCVEHLLPGVDPFIVAEIHRYAGGNPLFIEELCHSAAADVDRRPLERRLAGAAWLNGLIESRVARLPPAQAEIVRAAAVIGNVFPAWLLERITGHGPDDPLVRALTEQDFLFPSAQAGTMRFKHGITRDVVYGSVGLQRRKAMHLAVAVALGEHYADAPAEEGYEALAYHYAAADAPADAARYAELAGDKALAASALDRARAQYSAALAALDELAPLPREDLLRWCAIAQKLGMACVFDPLGLADGVALFERGVFLARQSGDLEAIARAEYWLGYICYAKGLARDATLHCEASLELSERIGDERLAAQVRATLGQVLTSAAEYDRALGLLDTAIDSKRKQSKPGSRVAVGSAYALACKGCLLGDQGLFGQAEECFQEALSLLGGSPHQVASSVRGWIAAVYMWQGRWEEALRVADEGARIAEQVRSRQLLAMTRALSGYSSWILARRPESLQVVRDATSWIEDRNGAFLTSLNYGWLIDGAVDLGRMDEARRHAARLFMRARQRDRIGEAMGCRALARAAAKNQDFARAEHYLGQALRSADARGSPHERAKTGLTRAQIEIERGRRREAEALLDAACAAFEAMNMPWYLQQARRVREVQ
ncbi:MAG TPA: AAA family ATPase [Burkholderiales bacterium]|nr:AAA family ATPase [Burkholderiales bacterium]